jgi:hypothetical protein
MKAASILRSLDKVRLIKLAETFGVSLMRANENADALTTRFARSLGVRLGWRESLEAILDALTNIEMRHFLAEQRWEVVRERGEDLYSEVYESARLAELGGADLRALILDLADTSEANEVEKTFVSRKWGAYFVLRERYPLDEHGARTGLARLSTDELANLTVADARDRNLIVDLAAVTGLSEASIRRRFEAAHGRTLLSNCFEDRWPPAPSAEILGLLNVADARERGLVAAIAEVTGMTPKGVVRRLNAVHGRTLLANCFSDRWPEENNLLLDANELAELNVAEALRRDLTEDIAEITGLSEAAVRGRLDNSHGRTLLLTCFDDHWPHAAREPLGANELSKLRVADAQREDLVASLAELTGLSEMGVRRRLNANHGRTLLTTCFADLWPQEAEAASLDELGRLTVADAFRQNLVERLSELTKMSGQGVKRRLNESHGRTLLITCFADRWPSNNTQPDTLNVDDLVGLNVADARDRDLVGSIAAITGMSPRGVRRRLNAAHGRTLLSTCFADRWPDDKVIDLNQLAQMNVGEARDRGLAATIADFLHLSEAAIARRLADAHGRTLLINCFEKEWSHENDSDSNRDSYRDVAQPWNKLRIVNRRYELNHSLGGGGFGTAFQARDLKFQDRVVVIKFPRDRETDTLDALHREFELTTALKQRHICTYYDCDDDKEFDIPFLVMEHGGESLEKMIDAGEQFDTRRAIELITQTAAALDHIHDDNKIHGDINSGNVLVTANGEVRLTDFGISAVTITEMREDGGLTKVARSQYGYHPVYRPLDHPLTRKSDQYNLALILCSMLLGEVFEETYHFKPLKGLTQAQNEVVRRALSANSRDRFESCTAFAQALRNR